MLQRSIRTAVTQQRSLDRLYIQKAAFAGLAISQKGIYQPRLAADRSTRISPLLSRFASSDTSSSPPPSTSASEESSSPSTAASTPEANSQSSDDRFDAAASEELLQAPGSTASQPIGRIQRRLSITFTCTVPDCGERSSHEFSRQAYEKGIVLVQCPKCDSRHLIGGRYYSHH